MDKSEPKHMADASFTVDPFDAQVGVFWDGDEFDGWVKEMGGEPNPLRPTRSAGAAATIQHDEDDHAWFALYLPPDALDADLWHEALHLTWYILQEHGVYINPDNHEIQCYLQGHIVGCMTKCMKPEESVSLSNQQDDNAA